MAAVPLDDVLLEALATSGIDPSRWARAFARLLPSLLAIPSAGLLAFPFALRLAFALMLAATVAPSLSPPPSSGPLLVVLGSEFARGIPVALSVAICLWGAAMAGNVIDELRGGHPAPGAAGPFGVLLALAALVGFLQLGGPARLAEALADAPPLGERGLRGAALALARGVQFAVALAGPLLAVVPFLELVHALAARAAAPLRIGALLEPAKALAVVGAAALLLDRIATGFVLWLDGALPVP